jgi:hypothetical protein
MSTRTLRRAALAAAILIPTTTIVPRARGQTPAPATPAASPARLTAEARREVVEAIATELGRHYVEGDTGRLIGEHLRKRLAGGAYDGITSPLQFAEALGADLRAVNGDGHLYVVYDAQRQPGMRPGPEGIRMLGPGSPGGPGGPGGPSPEAIANARRANFNLGSVNVLPGNVGYFELRGFSGASEAQDAVVAALRYLQHTDAVIIDLRRNGGGSPELVNFVISHFMGADSVPSLTVKNRSGSESFTRYTLATVPGPRRPSVPLYVLTSRYTASAGEDFAFVLKNLGRATIVGDRTAGLGRNNAVVAVGHGFGASISFTRVIDPKSGQEWEKVGVMPTVEVSQERALDMAHARALEQIAAGEQNPQRKRTLELARETLEAQVTPKRVAPGLMASYVGTYEGGRTVVMLDAALMYAPRPGAPPDRLVPLGDDTFGLGSTRFVFEREGGRVARLRLRFPDGGSLVFARAGGSSVSSQ